MNIKIKSELDFYKLKDWVDPKQLHWNKIITLKDGAHLIEKHIDLLNKEHMNKLSRNPFAIEILEKHIDKISWNDFVNNPNAIHIIEKNIDLCFKSLDWRGKLDLLRHPNFIYILEKHMDKIIDTLICSNCMFLLARQQNIIFIDLLEKIMEKKPEKIPNSLSGYFWNDLCQNPNAFRIIEKYLNMLTKYSWQLLAKNPNAIHIINEHLDKLDEMGWRNLSQNINAIPILKKNINKINWSSLSNNPNGIYIFEKYTEKIENYSFIDYENLNVNNPIFQIDYDIIRLRCSIYKEELMAVALQPSRIESYLSLGINSNDLNNYI